MKKKEKTDKQQDGHSSKQKNVSPEETRHKKDGSTRGRPKKTKKDNCEEKMTDLQTKYDELNDKYLRLYSDFDNFRKRKAKEFTEIVMTANKELVVDLLPVLDDFERAMQAMKEHQVDEESLKGTELIYNKLYNLLKQKGLSPMDSMGKEFDTDWHEAITNIPAPSKEQKGKVVDVIQKGYLLNDTIIRYAKVVVGN
ncbi:MAG: nucleotide exchange factor GrpE [Bacteroidales bacterium]|nr:nucleotide exchange factor GrpE [Bacteroidales bacterium]MCF6342326.1 nucleotide exchange factor GrpE [Bacteroidales bacterium]